jgi:hypothetical protein
MNKHLEKLYFNEDEPTFLGGVNALHRKAKEKYPQLKLKEVKSFLEKHEAFNRHKPVKRYKTLKTISAGLDVDHQIDLADVRRIKESNKGHSYILTCIDVLSKYGWAFPVKDKRAATVAKAYKKIIDEGRKPWRVFSDKGREFKGEFGQLLKDNDIMYITTENPNVKASLAERFNRTLKTRLYKYFTKSNTTHWLKILPKIVKAYNHSINRMTGMRPVDVTHKNDQLVYKRLYGESLRMRTRNQSKEGKFNVGDLVRIEEERGAFFRGYTPNFSKEIFVVSEKQKRDQIVYKLKDLKSEDLTSIFYEPELSKVGKNE